MPDPKKVVIDIFDHDRLQHKIGANAQNSVDNYMPDAKVYSTDEQNQGEYATTRRDIMDTIRQHVAEYGTIDELMISGHGGPYDLSLENAVRADIGDLLMDMKILEKELGVKICDRLVFSSCHAFSEMTPGHILYTRDMAIDMGMEIVGTTSTLSSSFGDMAAGYMVFTPEGELKLDKYNEEWISFMPIDQAEWRDHYIGKDFDEGFASHLEEVQKTANRKFHKDPVNEVLADQMVKEAMSDNGEVSKEELFDISYKIGEMLGGKVDIEYNNKEGEQDDLVLKVGEFTLDTYEVNLSEDVKGKGRI